MADTKNIDIIEELSKSINSHYDSQKRLLDRYQQEFDKAQEKGATKEYLAVLSGEISKLENSISKQNESASAFYETWCRQVSCDFIAIMGLDLKKCCIFAPRKKSNKY